MFLALRSIIRESGLRKAKLLSAIRAWPGYVSDRRAFRDAFGEVADDFTWGKELPILTEKVEASGGLGAYLLQDLTVARWIREDSPTRHFDVGSRIDGFVTNVASFRGIEVIDIRPAPGDIPGVIFHQCDLMGQCPPEWDGSIPSLSCLHTIEHFGLGRYGDPLDPLGHMKGIAQLKKMVAPGGMLYLSTPIGPQRIEFNAHRVFAAATLLGWFADGWEIERIAVIDDDAKLRQKVEPTAADIAENFGCHCGVGIVAARRKP
ncbi:MAG: DUF268 domain-containing protein [Luteolibacter sp.]